MHSDENVFSILSTAEIEQLAQFLSKALQHFNHYRSTNEEAFLSHLHVVADCYRLVLSQGGKNVLPDEHLKIFQVYVDLKTPGKTQKVSLAIAEMIRVVSDQIRLLSHPWFYPAYLAAIDNLLGDKLAYLHPNWQAGKVLRGKLIPRTQGSI